MTRRSLLGNLLAQGPMLTPLIDIIFLVLIFFMVHNSPSQRVLNVEPPSMSEAPPAEEENILLLAVRADQSYSIRLQQNSRILEEWHMPAIAALQQQLEALDSSRQIFSQVRRIRLRADQSLDYGSIIAICNLLYRWGLPLDLDVSG